MARLACGALVLAALLTTGSDARAWTLGGRADLAPWRERLELAPADPSGPAPRLTITYFGVATLLISDGRTSLMTDGFFTRVGLADLLLRRPVMPDLVAIGAGLAHARVEQLAAVLPVHSHYDHAMDAPEVARRTGALLVGSRSTAWIGRGGGLPDERIRVVEPGVALHFGDFSVTHFASRHVPLPFGQGALGQELDGPLVPPVPASRYVEGGSWSILIEHPLGSVLVQGSAGYLEGALAGVHADTVLLGIGALSRQDDAYREAYWREVVEAVGARRVIPIHYDDLSAPAACPFPAMPRLFDDVEESLGFLERKAQADPEVELALLPCREPAVLLRADGPPGG